MDLKSTQLKDTYGNLLTIGETEGSPTTGTLENGDGEDITNLTVAGDITIADKIIHSGDTNTAIRFPSADTVAIETAGAEAMRIDSSGNVLVGTTSVITQSGTTTGTRFSSDGIAWHIAEDAPSLFLGRTSTDGTIVDFRKDGSAVGIIGNKGSDLYIASENAGIWFRGGLTQDRIVPVDDSGSGLDNTVDLGDSGTRFENLYLGGNVILSSGAGIDFSDTPNSSGTMTSELLDDYEEGTFTLTMEPSAGFTATSNTVTARYTKIGNVVVVVGRPGMTIPASLGTYTNNDTGFFIKLSGLPFTIASNIQDRSVPALGVSTNIGVTGGYLAGAGTHNTDEITIFVNKDDGSTRTSPDLTVSTSVNIHFQFTYRV